MLSLIGTIIKPVNRISNKMLKNGTGFSIPDIELLPVEPPVQIPKEVPTPDTTDEILPDNIKGQDGHQGRNQ